MKRLSSVYCAIAAIVFLPSALLCQSDLDDGATKISQPDNAQAKITAATGTKIKQSFFGADFLLNNLVWPGTDGLSRIATLGGLRLWDDGVKWGQINTAAGVYNWTQMDSWIGWGPMQQLGVLFPF